MNVTVRLEIFSRPQEIENSRQYLLLRTDIYRKQSLGASGSYTSARLFYTYTQCESSLRKQPFRLALCRWGRFARRRLRLSNRNSILMT